MMPVRLFAMTPPRLNAARHKVISTWLLLALASFNLVTLGQIPEPHRERTLNGLTVLLDRRPVQSNVILSLRVHSGAAFDLNGKAGTMALMSDLLFPDPATREYIADELGGKLDVSESHDAIDVVISARATEFERLVELLRTALTGNPFTQEDFQRVRDARVKIAEQSGISPSTVADRAISARLFGAFPYARQPGGTPESLARIVRGDIIQARERFLNPNNSTLVVTGDLDQERVMRALRQLLGGWRKSETIVPPTFRQPSPPDDRVLIVNVPGGSSAEFRMAVRGVARSDKDYYAAEVLAEVLKNRMKAPSTVFAKGPTFVHNRAFVLPGMLTLGGVVPVSTARDAVSTSRRIVESVTSGPVSPEEFAIARSAVMADHQARTATPSGQAARWLDGITYNLPSIETERSAFDSMTPQDIQKLASRLFDKVPVAVVLAGDAGLIATTFGPGDKVESPTAASIPVTKPASNAPKP
jgi:zinc protease